MLHIMRTFQIPYSIAQHILSYTYNPQPAQLVHDIQNYYITKENLLKEYNKMWMEENIQVYIINDFANYIFATQTYSNSFYHIFCRHYMINNKKEAVRYMRWLDTIPLDTQIHIYWGLLQPHERNEFIEELQRPD